MNLFHATNYKIYNKNLSKDLRIVIISDLHFSNLINDPKLNKISKKLNELKPNYILFPGDIIDSLNEIENNNDFDRLLSWIKNLDTIVLFSLGGHDFYKKDTSNWKYQDPSKLVKGINALPNSYILDNTKYEDEYLFVTGYTQSMEYYNYPNNTSSIFHPIKENKNLLSKEIKELNKKIKSIPKNKISFLLAHSPVYFLDNDIQKEIKDYNYIVSGHMHNGCVPPILYEIWNSKRGIIAPCKELFPNNERNTLKKINDKLIVNGPLTMFHGKILKLFNSFYPHYITIIDFTNNTKYKDKLIIKKSYNK